MFLLAAWHVTVWHVTFFTSISKSSQTFVAFGHGAAMDQAISLLCCACPAVGCALPSSHPNVPECRLSAACAPLRAACCRRVASEQRRMSFLCSACAAVGYALVSFYPNAEEHVDDLAALARKKGCSQKAAEREGIRAGDCFCSIGQRVLIGLCFFHRVETSAPGLSGYYW